MEQAGAWVAGHDQAEFVVFPDSGATVRLLVRNFAVENTVTLESHAGTQDYALKAREERTVDFPVDDRTGAAVVRIKSTGGARPSDHEPGNLDMRVLGCWIEGR